jgi:hypothetical protein
MATRNLRAELNSLAANHGLDDSEILSNLVDILFDHHGSNTMPLFLRVQQRQLDAQAAERRMLLGGVEDAMHNFSSVAMGLVEEKGSKKAATTEVSRIIDGDNIAYTIRTCMAYFPSGTEGYASIAGKWFFLQFRDMLVKHRERYSSGGSSRSWANDMGYSAYIDLVLQNVDAKAEKK